MVWGGRDLEDHIAPTPYQRQGWMACTRPSCLQCAQPGSEGVLVHSEGRRFEVLSLDQQALSEAGTRALDQELASG